MRRNGELTSKNRTKQMLQDVEARTIAKVTKRLIPFLIVCYFVAYLDG